VSKKDNKVRDDKYQLSESDDEMSEVDMLLSEAPKDYYEASQSDDWVSSMNREIQSFKDMKVYEVCPREESRGKLIQSRWVYAVKTDPTAAEKEKSRIVVKGYTQKIGVNYSETYSPVMEFSNFLIICQYARTKKLSLWRFVISTVFLHADLKDDMYMEPPPGTGTNPNKVWKLKKAVYGLKQVSREWNKHLDQCLQSMGYKSLQREPCIYLHEDKDQILGVFVNDIVSPGLLNDHDFFFQRSLKFGIQIKNLGKCDEFLGVDIHVPDDRTCFLRTIP
jgi:hypothetical protein